MTAEEMLRALSQDGEDTGADFNDELDGYFGWKVDTSGPIPVLAVTFEDTAEGDSTTTYTASWALSEVPT